MRPHKPLLIIIVALLLPSLCGCGSLGAKRLDPEQIRETRLEDVGAELDAALRKAAAHGMREDEVLGHVHAVYSDVAGRGNTGQPAKEKGQVGGGKPGQASGNGRPGTGKAEQMTGGKNDDSDN